MLKAHVASVCFKCFRCFRGMLEVFHVDVEKVDRDVADVGSLLEACCKRFFKMFHLSDVCVQAFFIWMLHMFHTCCKSMFQ